MSDAPDNKVEISKGRDLQKQITRRTIWRQTTGTLVELLRSPCNLYNFMREMYGLFGGYVFVASAQYGVNQAVGLSLGNTARQVFFSDVLRIDGALGGRLYSAGQLPWAVEPLFGMLSDAIPILGYHRSSYIVIAAICGIIAYTCLGALPLSVFSAGAAVVPFLVLMNISVSMPDVMVDAQTAEHSKDHPEQASNLQSISWGALGLGGMIVAAFGGFVVDQVGPRPVFLMTNAVCLMTLIPMLLGWFGEKRLPVQQRKLNISWFHEHKGLSALALVMSSIAVLLSTLQVFIEDSNLRGTITVTCAAALCAAVFGILRQLSVVLAKVAVYIFLRGALSPAIGETMFQWLKNAPEGPQFSITILSMLNILSSAGLLMGVILYNKFLSNISYRRIFAGAQLLLVLTNFIDYAMVRRWNLLVGIPDVVMLISDDMFGTIMGRFFVMPMFILAAKVCPDSVEGTLFALLMALSNLGGEVADFFGVWMIEAFGVVKDGTTGVINYEGLPNLVLAKSACKLLSIFLIPLLVPNLTPSDPILPENTHEKEPKAADAKVADSKVETDLEQQHAPSSSEPPFVDLVSDPQLTPRVSI
eukprot:TRINITY_DN20973_c0_g1_i1.p1 TRINITY_DN20973_c0_g1~~TRINITY_DN20973_c0_g1_i1.p1  ORF type:complete len:613 (+),score=90.99 TRINITY_DN20973_c0_g1_i1:79-1839(+)